MEWKGERLGIVETRPHYTNYLDTFFQTLQAKLVTEDNPQALFAILNEKFHAGYEVV
jgi:hypothetical protein